MKKLIIITLLVTSLFSCEQEKEYYNIICNVENAEGIELVYYAQGEDFKESQIKKITNGKVVFEMTNKPNQIGYIGSYFNIKNGYRSKLLVLPEKKTIIIKFDLVKDSVQVDYDVFEPVFSFRDISFENNSVNQKYKDLRSELIKKENYPQIPITESTLDSLSENVFPPYKANILNFYNKKIYNTTLDENLKIEFLTNVLVAGFFFEKVNYISAEEKEKINLFFNEVKSSTNNSYNYFKLKEKINSINKVKSKKIRFKDFKLEDINKNIVSLSSIVDKNDYTAFYFWVYNCRPCREFNKKMKFQNKNLSENNIEVININVDLTRKYWKKGTEEDSIFWKEIYMPERTQIYTVIIE